MFSLLSGFWEYFFAPQNYHILIIGLDHAGKTTLLERIKTRYGVAPGLPPEKIVPTIGMNLAKIKYQGAQIIFWDLGGQVRMRSMWEKYYTEANAVIYVVDSADVSRLEEAKNTFDRLFEDESLMKSETPLITFANKQDLPDSLSAGDLVINFHPHRFSDGHVAPPSGSSIAAVDRPFVFGVSALTCEGLDEAIAAVVATARIHKRRNHSN